MDTIALRHKSKKNGKTLEFDVFGYSNGETNKAVIVEVKSHLREKHIEQILIQLNEAKYFMPEHSNKRFYGILAAVDSSESLKTQVLNSGLYYAEIHNDLFELKLPIDFQAKAF